GVVAVNANSSRRIEPVALDGGDDLSGVTTENGSAEPPLQLKQRRHIGAPLPHDAPRSAGPQAEEGWCPTRSEWAPAPSARAARRCGVKPPDRLCDPGTVVVDQDTHVLGNAMASEVDLADRLDRQCVEIGKRIEPEIPRADMDVVDVAEDAAAGSMGDFRHKL